MFRSGRVNYWTGVEGRAFEHEFAAAVDAPYAVALSNGTVALELALHAVGIGPGDEVVVTARTFVATASAVVAVARGRWSPTFDPVSQTLTAATVEAVRTPLNARGDSRAPGRLAGALWPS